MRKFSKKYSTSLDGPLLDKVKVTIPDDIDQNSYPFSLSIIKNLHEINFFTAVTFFVGENGTGKSTILEALALKAGFGFEGGSKNISFRTADEKFYTPIEKFSERFTLSWRKKPQNGYFFKAESFFNVANYIDVLAQTDWQAYASYGGKSLHEQSHGESFLSFFQNRLGNAGFFILDEPEAALSPQKQLTLMLIIHEMCKNSYNAQFIIATHSPLLLAFPQATIYSCDSEVLKTISYQDSQHYQITKQFLDNPEQYLHYLFHE